MTARARKPVAPAWWEKAPADMTTDELSEAQGYFSSGLSALDTRLGKYRNAQEAITRALIDRLGIPHDNALGPPPYPDLTEDDLV